MGDCSDCHLPKWNEAEAAAFEAAGSPDVPWCECPILKKEPYTYGEEDNPEE